MSFTCLLNFRHFCCRFCCCLFWLCFNITFLCYWCWYNLLSNFCRWFLCSYLGFNLCFLINSCFCLCSSSWLCLHFRFRTWYSFRWFILLNNFSFNFTFFKYKWSLTFDLLVLLNFVKSNFIKDSSLCLFTSDYLSDCAI